MKVKRRRHDAGSAARGKNNSTNCVLDDFNQYLSSISRSGRSNQITDGSNSLPMLTHNLAYINLPHPEPINHPLVLLVSKNR